MIDLRKEVIRAGEARQIIDAPIFQEARKTLEDHMAKIRRTVPLRDTDMHTRVILMEQLATVFFEYFEQIAQTGQMAEIQLRQEAEKKSMLEKGIAMFRTSGRV